MKASEIQERLSTIWEIDANERDIQRDLNALSREDFPITCDTKGRTNYWYWSGDELIDIPGMGRYAALTFNLARDYLLPLMPRSSLRYLQPHFDEANRVLRKNTGELTNWLDKIRVIPRQIHQRKADVPDQILDAVYEALYDNKRLEVQYKALSSGKQKTHKLDPLQLAYRDTVTELIAISDRSGKPGRFMLHRFNTAVVLDEACKIPPELDVERTVEELLAFPMSGKTIHFKAWLHDMASHHVRETPISDDQRIQNIKDGIELTATVRDTIELRWWITGLGDRIKVLEPHYIRDEIKLTAQKVVALYE